MTISDLATKPSAITSLDVMKVLDSNCLHQVQINAVDRLTGLSRQMFVPCGNCLACRSAKQDEWSSRMLLHSLSYAHVYFVTLTYAPIYERDLEIPSKRFVLEQTADLYWHYDDYNSTHRFCWSPCLTSRTAVPAFLKRLRSYVSQPLTYVYCTENGSHYGRPHYHLIIFSNDPISKTNIQDAWSLAYTERDGVCYPSRGQYADHVQLGSIYLEDVKSECFLEQDPENKIKGRTRGKCFTYVAKYVGKKDADFDTTRIKFAYEIYKHNSHAPSINRALLNSICDKYGFPYPFTDEECSFQHFADFLRDNLPRVRFSLRTPIGSIYFQQHADQLENAAQVGLHVLGQALYFPKYFRRKLLARHYPFQIESFNAEGKTTASGGTLAYWHQIIDFCHSHEYLLCVEHPARAFDADPFRYALAFDERLNRSYVSELLGNHRDFAGLRDPLHGTHFRFLPDQVIEVVYNRSTRSYDVVSHFTYSDFGDMLEYYLPNLCHDLADLSSQVLQSQRTYVKALERIQTSGLSLADMYVRHTKHAVAMYREYLSTHRNAL